MSLLRHFAVHHRADDHLGGGRPRPRFPDQAGLSQCPVTTLVPPQLKGTNSVETIAPLGVYWSDTEIADRHPVPLIANLPT